MLRAVFHFFNEIRNNLEAHLFSVDTADKCRNTPDLNLKNKKPDLILVGSGYYK